jgi:hypothetical protein
MLCKGLSAVWISMPLATATGADPISFTPRNVYVGLYRPVSNGQAVC